MAFLTNAGCSYSLPSEDDCVRVIDNIDRHRYAIVVCSSRTLLVCMLSLLPSLISYVGLVSAFMAFFVYEQYEPEIDGLVDILLTGLKEFTIYLMRILPVSVSRLLHYHDNSQRYKGPGYAKELR